METILKKSTTNHTIRQHYDPIHLGTAIVSASGCVRISACLLFPPEATSIVWNESSVSWLSLENYNYSYRGYTIPTAERLKKTDRQMHFMSIALVSDPLKVEMHRQWANLTSVRGLNIPTSIELNFSYCSWLWPSAFKQNQNKYWKNKHCIFNIVSSK